METEIARKPKCVPDEAWDRGLAYLAKIMESHYGESLILSWTAGELASIPEPLDSIAENESGYRRGYMHGYLQAGENCRELYGCGFARGTEIGSMLLHFAETSIAEWRYMAPKEEMVEPPQLKHESWESIRHRILRRDGGKCVICGDVIKLEVDHIEPVCEGGLPFDDNLRTLCIGCHKKRNRKAGR